MADLRSLFEQDNKDSAQSALHIPARSKKVQELKKKLAKLRKR